VPENAIFVNAALLDQWVTSGRADVDVGTFTVRGTGEKLRAKEAVRVLSDATGGGDPRGWVGRVYPTSELLALGAEILDRSLVIGDLAYDVDPGFLLGPIGVGEPAQAMVSRLLSLSRGPGDGQSDEELLARYLMTRL
jgi:hypothetical protein